MRATAIILLLLASQVTFAKSVQAKKIDLRHSMGLLEKISCSYSGRTPTGSSIGSVDFASIDQKNVVCDPLSNSASTSPDNGLLARLILRTPEMGASVKSVMSYLNNGLWMDQKIYFSDVNVPTRNFTEGFTTQSGEVLRDAQGNKLIQDFSLEYTSTLQLGTDNKEGEYEIATLSDDGSRLFINENGTWNELINNDGDHPTRMGCPYRTIHMDKNSKVDIKLLYYQGPGTSLANVLIWRRHKKALAWDNPSRHSLCGLQGDKYFFNSKSSKTLAMRWLNKEGWNILTPANFKMPVYAPNPCITLGISNFTVASVQSTAATLTWNTSLPATSQLRIINAFTGEEIITPFDANLVTEHSVVISGLVAGVIYRVQAISGDNQGHVVTSDALVVAPN